MVDEMLVAQAKWLPQYAAEIPLARKRLEAVKRKGAYKGTKKWEGAARRKVRTLQQLRKEGAKAKDVMAADKAGMSTKKTPGKATPGRKARK